MSVKLFLSACIWLKSKSAYNERWLCGGQRFSDSEWNRILKAGDLVVFGVSLWSCLVLQIAKYVNVEITSISGTMAFQSGVWDVGISNKIGHKHDPCVI